MRGPLVTIALWLGATALAVGVGWSATSLVANRVTGPPDIAVGLVQDGTGAPSTGVPGASPAPSVAPSTPPAPARAETRTVSVVGGSAALRFADGRVEVLWATPSAGFNADIEDATGQPEARVDFRSPDHRSRIKGEWQDGRPSVEIEERPDD